MTQVEIPQLSLGRYVELLKRRRWQLVPVSLLGLLVGGLVAFFIPRYFVAEVLLVHSQLPGVDSVREENPFAEIVDTAMSAIPTAVGETLDALAWPEAMALDGFERDQYERAVEARVWVDDGNAFEKKRTYAKLKVTYLDRDGARAADFCNKLVEVWIQKRIREVRLPAEEVQRRATREADRWLRLLDDYTKEKQVLETTYGILPNYDPMVQRQELLADAALERQLEEQRRKKAVELVVLEKALADAKALLGDTPERVALDSAEAQAKVLETPQGKDLVTRMLIVQASLPTFRPGSDPWLSKKREFEALQVLLQNLTAQAVTDPDGTIPNPEHALRIEAVQQAEGAVIERRAEVEQLDRDLARRRERNEGLAEGYRLYEKKLAEIAEAREQRAAAVLKQTEANEAVARLTVDTPVRVERAAKPPPAPTEPNILLVALVGCVLGLGAAIGLILLLDFLQGTFKTIDDVERGLTLPVLGGIAHLETAVERRLAVRGRRRASLVAVLLLGLIAAIVVIFYVDPSALPTWARDVLQVVLGP